MDLAATEPCTASSDSDSSNYMCHCRAAPESVLGLGSISPGQDVYVIARKHHWLSSPDWQREPNEHDGQCVRGADDLFPLCGLH